MRKPTEYLTILKRELSFPEGGDEFAYERAYWCYELRNAMKWLMEWADRSLRAEVDGINDAGLTSDDYKIIPVVRRTSKVKVALMRERYPDYFKKFVHLQNSDYVKILGREELYYLAASKLGEDEIQKYERVNVDAVERRMPEDAAGELLEHMEKITDWDVMEIEEYLSSVYEDLGSGDSGGLGDSGGSGSSGGSGELSESGDSSEV